MIKVSNVFRNLKVASKIYSDRNRFLELLKDSSKLKDLEEFKQIRHKLELTLNLSKDFILGEYRSIGKTSMLMIIASFVYLVNPMDIVPDILLGVGFLDDLKVFNYMLKKIEKELDKYENFKRL